MTEWRPSGPKQGKRGPGTLSRAARIAMKRPEVRNASRLAPSFELPNVPDAAVIILTARSARRPYALRRP